MKLNLDKTLITIGIILFSFGIVIFYTGTTGYFIFPTKDKQTNNIYGSGISVFGIGLMILGFGKKREEKPKEKPYDLGQKAFSLLGSLGVLKEDAKSVEKSRKELEEFKENEPRYRKNLQEGLEAARTKYRRFESTVPHPLSREDQEALYEIKKRIQNYEAAIESLPEEYTQMSTSWKLKSKEWKGSLKQFADTMLEFSKKYRDKETIDDTTSSYAIALHEYLEGFLRAPYASALLKYLPEISRKLHDALTNLETKQKYDMSKRP